MPLVPLVRCGAPGRGRVALPAWALPAWGLFLYTIVVFVDRADLLTGVRRVQNFRARIPRTKRSRRRARRSRACGMASAPGASAQQYSGAPHENHEGRSTNHDRAARSCPPRAGGGRRWRTVGSQGAGRSQIALCHKDSTCRWPIRITKTKTQPNLGGCGLCRCALRVPARPLSTVAGAQAPRCAVGEWSLSGRC